jgi:hypothetical protein
VAEATTYNLRDDFSTTENPHGVWSYNLNGSPITQTFSGELGTGWCYASNWDGCIIRAADISGGALDIGSGEDWAEGDIIVHPYTWGGDDSITWTAPSAGLISISGLAWAAAYFSDRDAEWTLTLNDDILASRSTIYGTRRTDAAAAFANNVVSGKTLSDIVVAPGDVVAFTPHPTTGYAHFTGIDMTVDLSDFSLPGDANLDGKVDVNDLTIVLTSYGQSGKLWTQGDFNGDSTVDVNDLTITLTNYGKTSGAGIAAVPEPSCVVLVGIAAVCLFTILWRRRP